MGSYQFIFAFSSLLIQSLTIGFVEAMDGEGHGCGETAATAYAVIGLVVNTISVLSGKGVMEEELNSGKHPEMMKIFHH